MGNSVQYILVRIEKSVGIAIILTLLLGPIGLFYSTVAGGFTMLAVSAVLVVKFFMNPLDLSFLAILFILTPIYWIICLAWAIFAVLEYNDKLRTKTIAHGRESSQITPDNIVNDDFRRWQEHNPNASLNDYLKLKQDPSMTGID